MVAKTTIPPVPKMEVVKTEAIKTLIRQLGITKSAFFIRETMSQNVDYLILKEELFGRKTAQDLYNEIKKR